MKNSLTGIACAAVSFSALPLDGRQQRNITGVLIIQMIEIKPLERLEPDDLRRLVTGYISAAKYVVMKLESDDQIRIRLDLAPLDRPYIKQYAYLDEATLQRYQEVPKIGFSFGAYNAEELVGIALAAPQTWNNSLWVWKFHIAETHRRKGIGGQLMGCLEEKGRQAGFRTIVCETQNTNVPAIRFYRKNGFTIEGIDLSYYTNADFPDGEIAIFLKKRLT